MLILLGFIFTSVCVGGTVTAASGSESVRLVSQTGRTAGQAAGRLQILIDEQWGTVCDDFFSITDATVACRQLGFSSAIGYNNAGNLGYSTMDVGPIWLDDLHCVSSDTDLTQCKHNGIGVNNCINREDIILSCLTEGSLRLVTSGSISAPATFFPAGRLEIYIDGRWGTVCDDRFSSISAKIACQQLGFTNAARWTHVGAQRVFPSASSDKDILLDDIECTADDTTLLSCQHGGVGINNCAHFEDVVVYCDNHSSNVATRSPSSTDYPYSLTTIVGGVVGGLSFIIFSCSPVIICIIVALCSSSAQHRRNRQIPPHTSALAVPIADHSLSAQYLGSAYSSTPQLTPRTSVEAHPSVIPQDPPPAYEAVDSYPSPTFPTLTQSQHTIPGTVPAEGGDTSQQQLHPTPGQHPCPQSLRSMLPRSEGAGSSSSTVQDPQQSSSTIPNQISPPTAVRSDYSIQTGQPPHPMQGSTSCPAHGATDPPNLVQSIPSTARPPPMTESPHPVQSVANGALPPQTSAHPVQSAGTVREPTRPQSPQTTQPPFLLKLIARSSQTAEHTVLTAVPVREPTQPQGTQLMAYLARDTQPSQTTEHPAAAPVQEPQGMGQQRYHLKPIIEHPALDKQHPQTIQHSLQNATPVSEQTQPQCITHAPKTGEPPHHLKSIIGHPPLDTQPSPVQSAAPFQEPTQPEDMASLQPPLASAGTVLQDSVSSITDPSLLELEEPVPAQNSSQLEDIVSSAPNQSQYPTEGPLQPGPMINQPLPAYVHRPVQSTSSSASSVNQFQDMIVLDPDVVLATQTDSPLPAVQDTPAPLHYQPLPLQTPSNLQPDSTPNQPSRESQADPALSTPYPEQPDGIPPPAASAPEDSSQLQPQGDLKNQPPHPADATLMEYPYVVQTESPLPSVQDTPSPLHYQPLPLQPPSNLQPDSTPNQPSLKTPADSALPTPYSEQSDGIPPTVPSSSEDSSQLQPQGDTQKQPPIAPHPADATLVEYPNLPPPYPDVESTPHSTPPSY